MAEAGPNVGFATLSIIPSLKGVEAAVAGQLAPVEAAAAKSGTKAGSSFTSSFAGAFKQIGVGVVAFAAVGAAAVGSAIQVEDAQNIILRATGATGKAADALKDSFENVAKTTPASFKTVATALAEVSQRTGLTGTALETLTKQVVTFNRITKDSPVNVQDLTKAFAGFGIPASKLSASFDQLFKTSQKTGVPLETLVTTVTKAGPVFRQFGIGASTTAGLLAQLDKAGIESGTAIAGLRAAFNKFAKAGIAPEEGLKKTLAAIQALLKAGDEAGANKLAQSVFGGRGVGLVDAAKQGKLSLDTLSKSFSQTGDTILETAKKTSTVGGKLGILSNNLKLQGAKLGVPILEALNKVLALLVPLVQRFSPIILTLVAAFAAMKIITGLIGAVHAFAGAIQLLNLAFLANPVVLVVVGLVALGAAIVLAYQKIKPFRDAVDATGRALVKAFDFVKQNKAIQVLIAVLFPFIGLPLIIIANWSKLTAFFQTLIANIVSFFSTGFGQNLVGFVTSTFQNMVTIIQGALQVIIGLFDFFKALLTGDWAGAWNALKDIVAGIWQVIQGIIGQAVLQLVTILKTGLAIAIAVVKAGIDTIGAFFLSLPGRIGALAAAAGGAALAVGAAILHGLSAGISGAVGALADIGKAVAHAIASFVNRFVINPINDALDFTIDLGPFGKHHISAPDIPPLSFATGGVVPGPAGAPILAIVHGGEQILTKDQQAAGGGTTNITLIGSTVTADDIFRAARWEQLTGKVKKAG